MSKPAGTAAPGARRTLKVRTTSTLGVVAAAVSDRTAPAVLGLEPRVFRELVARANIPHARVGRRVVARLDDVLAAFDELAAQTRAVDAAAELEDDEDPQPRNADDVLARIGLKRRR